jgi:ABC-type nitrate/sulfonate/bicarbonate transport system substrate-binding protein
MTGNSVWHGIAITFVALATAVSANPQEKIAVGDQPALTAMVASVGIAKGFFREEGLEVTQVFGQRPTDIIPAALAGKIHFGYSGIPPLLAASANGAELVAIGLFSHGYSGILVASKANATLKTLAEFRGKRIGMQRGTGVATVFQIALDRLGLNERDFHISNLRIADMPTAMQGGTFDAVLGWEPNMSRIVSLGYGVKVITPEQFEQIAGITYAFPLFTTRDIVKRRPDLVQKFMNAFAKAQSFAHTERAESLQILRKTLGDAIRHTSDAELETLAYVYKKDRVAFSDNDMKDFEIMRNFMFKDGQIKTKPDLSELIDNSFAQKAEQKFKASK